MEAHAPAFSRPIGYSAPMDALDRIAADPYATVTPYGGDLHVTKSSSVTANRVVTLSNGMQFQLQRFAAIGKGDKVEVRGTDSSPTLAVRCRNGRAEIWPPFTSSAHLSSLSSQLRIKELDQPFELDAYERLASYHYRNNAGFGRKAVLVARIGSGPSARVIGYVEITNTFSGHEARNRLFDAEFSGEGGVRWLRWNLEAKKAYLNTIARIARCVVHPEFRGAGIGKALCQAAAGYCKSGWQIAGWKPEFLEITADMLKFVPFAERAGMVYIGSTTGNIQRLLKDQTYLKNVSDDIQSGIRTADSHAVFADSAKSILKRQKRDLVELSQMSEDSGFNVLEVLRTYVSAAAPQDLPPSAYRMLHRFLRFPKPTYMVGLTRQASNFIARRLQEVATSFPAIVPDFQTAQWSGSIRVSNVSVTHSLSIPTAPWANALHEAFGTHSDTVSYTGVRNISLSIKAGEILYVWGPSGSGKTVFLQALLGRAAISGSVSGIQLHDIAELQLSFTDQPIVLEVGARDITEALWVLNAVGLSEASMYFKSAAHLRARLRRIPKAALA